MDRFSIKRAFVEKIIYKNFSLHLKINHSSKIYIYIYMYVRSRQLVTNVKKRKEIIKEPIAAFKRKQKHLLSANRKI